MQTQEISLGPLLKGQLSASKEIVINVDLITINTILKRIISDFKTPPLDKSFKINFLKEIINCYLSMFCNIQKENIIFEKIYKDGIQIKIKNFNQDSIITIEELFENEKESRLKTGTINKIKKLFGRQVVYVSEVLSFLRENRNNYNLTVKSFGGEKHLRLLKTVLKENNFDF